MSHEKSVEALELIRKILEERGVYSLEGEFREKVTDVTYITACMLAMFATLSFDESTRLKDALTLCDAVKTSTLNMLSGFEDRLKKKEIRDA